MVLGVSPASVLPGWSMAHVGVGECPLLPCSLLAAPSRVHGPWHGLRNSTLSQALSSFLSRVQGCSCLPLVTSGTSYPRVSAAEALVAAGAQGERKKRPPSWHQLQLPLSLQSPIGQDEAGLGPVRLSLAMGRQGEVSPYPQAWVSS